LAVRLITTSAVQPCALDACGSEGQISKLYSGIVEDGDCLYPAGVDELKEQRGSAWQAAIDYGIDVSLLEENLRLTPDERLAQLVAMQRFYDAVRAERAERDGEG
jgi:hypothetical protein